MNKILIAILTFFTLFLSGYDFNNKHYIGSYKKCNRERLRWPLHLLSAFNGAIDASGATVLSYKYEIFEPHGITAVFLLSESHASIHTYPEHDSCFVDLFTCGEKCDWEPFDKIMRAYLEPEKVEWQVIERN